MLYKLVKNIKLRIWHFLFMPTNVANVLTGKKSLSLLVDELSAKDEYFLVYQYGKSGSSTVYQYFKNLGLTTIHCHNLNDKTLKLREQIAIDATMPRKVSGQRFFSNARYRVYQAILVNNNAADIYMFISLREPIGFVRSVYFQQWSLFSVLTKRKFGELTPTRFCEYFNDLLIEITEYLDLEPDQQKIETLILSQAMSIGARCMLHFIYGYMYWFENELFEVFGLNSDDLKLEQGYWSFNKGNIRGSVIKVEDFDSALLKSVEGLLNKDIKMPIVNQNVGSNKANHAFYSYLKENSHLPEVIVNVMKNSFSYRYFYGIN